MIQLSRSPASVFIRSIGGARTGIKYAIYGRSHHTVQSFGGYIYLFAGRCYESRKDSTQVQSMDDLWRSADGVTWEEMDYSIWQANPTPPPATIDTGVKIGGNVLPGMVSAGSLLYVTQGGGGTGGNTYYTEDGEKFYFKATLGADNRRGNAFVLFNLAPWYIEGGADYNNIDSYELRTGGWFYNRTVKANTQWCGCAATFNGKIYAAGGSYLHAGSYANATRNLLYSSDGTTWTQTTGAFPAFSDGVMLVYNSYLWLIFPQSGSNLEVWRSINGTSWSLISDDIDVPPRQYFSACVHDGKMWIIGGYYGIGGGTAPAYSDVWYSTDGISWTKSADNLEWGRKV